MTTMTNDERLVARLSLSLLTLDMTLKLIMSHLRSSGAHGEGDHNGFFEKMSKIQLLTAEYVPTTVVIMNMVVRYVQRPLTEFEQIMLKVATASRFVFAIRALDGRVNSKGYNVKSGPGAGVLSLSVFGLGGATASYVANFALLGLIYKALA